MAELLRTRLLLASGSPRRRDLLARAGISFDAWPADIDESPALDETPDDTARRLAREKALAVARRAGPHPARLVLGADTVVVIDGEGLGKPVDPRDAVRLLSRLVGRTHRVVSAVSVVRSDTLEARQTRVESAVTLRPAETAEIEAYVATGEPLDKAGAYALQGEGRRFVTRVEGSETNVIGLPMDETLALLRALGLADSAA
jgi:septum formation protein